MCAKLTPNGRLEFRRSDHVGHETVNGKDVQDNDGYHVRPYDLLPTAAIVGFLVSFSADVLQRVLVPVPLVGLRYGRRVCARLHHIVNDDGSAQQLTRRNFNINLNFSTKDFGKLRKTIAWKHLSNKC